MRGVEGESPRPLLRQHRQRGEGHRVPPPQVGKVMRLRPGRPSNISLLGKCTPALQLRRAADIKCTASLTCTEYLCAHWKRSPWSARQQRGESPYACHDMCRGDGKRQRAYRRVQQNGKHGGGVNRDINLAATATASRAADRFELQ